MSTSSDSNRKPSQGSKEAEAKQDHPPTAPTTSEAKESATRQKELVRCGLENLGYTCYINSVLQMLYDWCKFRNYMLSHRGYGEFHGILAGLFRATMYKASTVVAVVAPEVWAKELISHFREARSEFIAGQQHDAQQFLTALLKLLHDEVNQMVELSAEELAAAPRPTLAEEAWQFHMYHFDNSFFSHCLLGQVQLTLTCLECGQQTNSWSFIWQLEVHLPQDASPDESHGSDKESQKTPKLSNCIAEYFEKKTLQGASAPFCGHCASPKPATKQSSLCRAPPFLLVYLKRFSCGRMENKRPVDIDQQLHIGGQRYSLMSVVLQDGTEPGHYGTVCAVQPSGAFQWQFRCISLEDDQIAEGKSGELTTLLKKKPANLALYQADDHN